MKFTYETQGASTYLVCELEPTEQLDSLTLGMLTNNHIPGLAPVIHTEMNGQRFLKYNISAKITMDQFFGGNTNKQRALMALENILDALCLADDYMIDQSCFLVMPEYVYLNVSNCETALICIPVNNSKNFNQEIADAFKKILEHAQFDPSENAGYVTEMSTYLNSGESFNIYGFKDLIVKLKNTNSVMQPQMQNNGYVASSKPVTPVGAYDSTITMDDMVSMMGQQSVPPQLQQVVPPQPVVQPQPVAAHQPIVSTQPVVPPQPVAPHQTVVSPQPVVPPQPVAPHRSVVSPQPMTRPQSPIQGQRPISRVPQGNPQNGMASIPIPPAQGGPGFAIPGQPANVSKALESQKKEKKKEKQKLEKKTDDSDKKMTFFGLLSNYNKENAALYKTQKEAAKKEKELSKKAASSVKTAGNTKQQNVTPVNSVPSAQSNMQSNAQPIAQPQYQPPVQPVPVINSFNETTVLSSFVGETTVLDASALAMEPHLTRVKTGERIAINKPVFRIGKEKSYVDYFIADNTAISRSHCNIHKENGEYFIEDTNSTNHTYINGTIITSNVKIKLTNGDKIRLANEDFTFSL